MSVLGIVILVISVLFLASGHSTKTTMWRSWFGGQSQVEDKRDGERPEEVDESRNQDTEDGRSETPEGNREEETKIMVSHDQKDIKVEQTHFNTNEHNTQDEESDDQKTPLANPSAQSISVPSFTLDNDNDNDNDSDTETSDTNTLPAVPSFPAANSPQRAMPPPPPPSTRPKDSSLMPPPPKPTANTTAQRTNLLPPRGPPTSFPSANSAQRASSSSSSLMPPPTRSLAPPSTRGPPPSSASLSRQQPQASRIDTPRSKKIQLPPGFSPLDWAALSTSKSLANVPSYLRVTPSLLKQQNGRKGKDAWSVYKGKVYNITPYEKFHPGGKGELMRGAGKDATQMFLEVHPWVNWEGMLRSCEVGVLVPEGDGGDGEEGLEGLD